MSTATFGTNAVDWEERIRFDRLRDERLARLKAELERSDLGALLAFDFSNIRYMTATHIGTWAMDKLIRFALLTRNTDPIVWDFGSAAKHHQLLQPVAGDDDAPRPTPTRTRRTTARCGRGWRAARGPASRPCAARSAPTPGSPTRSRAKIKRELEKFGAGRRAARRRRDRAADPVRAAEGRASTSSTASRCSCSARADQDRRTRSRCSPRRPRWSTPPTTSSTSSCAPACGRTRPSGWSPRRSTTSGSEYVEGVNAISGERCSPHPHVYSDRIIRPGDPAFFDILHSFNGYRTCYYRTFAVGSASPAQHDAYKRAREYMDRAIALVRPGRDDRRHRRGLADRAGVRLPGRGGRVRPAVRPRRRAVDLGEADLLPAGLARAPGGARGGDVLRPRDLLAVAPTASAPRASRRRSWSPPTGARWSPSSRPRTCWSPGQRYFSVGGPLPRAAQLAVAPQHRGGPRRG